MVIRQFRIKATGQVWDGFYLQDGSGDIQCLTNKGHEIFYEWEFEKPNEETKCTLSGIKII